MNRIESQRFTAALTAMSDAAYCAYIKTMGSPACLGWEAKLRAGEFRKENVESLMRAAEMLGRHRALAEVVRPEEAACTNERPE